MAKKRNTHYCFVVEDQNKLKEALIRIILARLLYSNRTEDAPVCQ